MRLTQIGLGGTSSDTPQYLAGAILLSFYLGVLVLGQGASQAQQEDAQVQEDPIRVDVNLVMLRFTVKDAQQQFANTLAEKDSKHDFD